MLALLEDQAITHLVVEHTDRLTRFSFRCLDTLLRGQRRTLEVVHEAGNEMDGLLADLTGSIYSFCACRYGQGGEKWKTVAIVQERERERERERPGRAAMQLVEQHVICRSDSRFAVIDAAAFAAKNLYNLRYTLPSHQAYGRLYGLAAQGFE